MATSRLSTRRVDWRVQVGTSNKAAQGIVIFEASVSYIPDPLAAGGPRTAIPEPVPAVLDSSGYACTPDPANPARAGERGVNLFTTDSLGEDGGHWTWTARPQLRSVNGIQMSNAVPAFSFAVPTGAGTLDLATVQKVPASPGLGEAQAVALLSQYKSDVDSVVARANAGEFKGDRGLPGVNAIPASEAVAEYAATLGNPLQLVLHATYATNTVLASPVRFPQIDPSGARNSAAGLQQAALATPDGGTLIIPKGTYRCDGTAINLIGADAKNLTISMYGAEFVMNGPDPVFNFDGTYETALPVSKVQSTTTTDDTTGTNPAVAITILGNASAWSKGDVIKIIADDVIPGGRPGSNGQESRIGEYMIVSNVFAGVATCIGSLRESYQTNVRVARLRNIAIHLRGGRFTTAASGLSGDWTSNMIQFSAMVGPTVTDTVIASTPYSGFRFSGCYGYTVIGAEVEYAKNGPINNGYGIQDSSSAFGRISNYRARRVRHAFTDGTAFIASGTSDPRNYGGTYGTQISNSVAYGTSNTAWDTHAWSENVTFSDCQAIDSYKGFNLRGRKHKVIDCAAIRCFTGGLYIFTETNGGESWGHYVKNFLAEEVPTRALELYVNQTGSPNSGANESRMSHIDGFFIRGGNEDSVFVRNGNVRIDNLHYIAGRTLGTAPKLARIRNARVEGTNWIQDLRQVVDGSSVVLVRLELNATVELGEWECRTTDANAYMISYAIEAESSSLRAYIRKLTMSHPPGYISTTLGEGTRFDWEYLSTGENSAFITERDAAVSSPGGVVTTISRTRAPMVIARLNASTGAQTLPAFKPGAVRGQMLRVWNTSTTNTVTIPHGTAAFRTFLSGGTDLTLAPNQQVLLTWIGTTWWQV